MSLITLSSSATGFGPPDGGGSGSHTVMQFKDTGFNKLAHLNDVPDMPSYTTDLMGDKVSLHTGSLQFEQTDISIPGNSNIPVELTRTLSSPDAWFKETLDFANWSLSIPHARSTYITEQNGDAKSNYWANGDTCTDNLNSNSTFSKSYEGQKYYGYSSSYWQGDSVSIPGKGTVTLTTKDGDNSYKRYNNKNWKVDCLSKNSQGHEGFKVITTDGLVYHLTHFKAVKSAKPFTLQSIPPSRQCLATGSAACVENPIVLYPSNPPSALEYPLINAFLLATKVEDRFGNWVTYSYNSNDQLTSIQSNDGRSIQIYYTSSAADARIDRAVANGKTWHYDYHDQSGRMGTLSAVTRPDNKQWQFSHIKDVYTPFWNKARLAEHTQVPFMGDSCIEGYSGNFITITHPEGAEAEFTVGEECHGTTNVKKIRKIDAMRVGIDDHWIKHDYNVFSIKKKSLLLQDGTEYVWNYDYSDNPGMFSGDAPTSTNRVTLELDTIETAHLTTTTLENPDGATETHFFDRKKGPSEGNLMYIEYRSPSGSLLKGKKYLYQNGVNHGYSRVVDHIGGPAMDGWIESDILSVKATHVQRTTKQKTYVNYGGNTDEYTTDYSSFDSYDFPSITKESNSFKPDLKYTKQTYYHDTANWLIGLPSVQSISTNGSAYQEVRSTSYYSAAGSYKSLPYQEKSFGNWYQQYDVYHTSGSQAGLLKTLKYNRANSEILFDNYKRGVPQTISQRQNNSTAYHSAYQVVDNDGRITKQTDFEGHCSSYSFNSIGRMTYVNPCNSYWTDTSISYADTTWSEGYPSVTAGMLKRSVSQGNYRKDTYYDGLLRPRFTAEWDNSNKTGTIRYQRLAYNIRTNQRMLAK
ncbi:hypothetical protein [Shewanella pneumatophori]|uniref:Uncharacterized protein n=1 Tax=Shewanella pneumatophori TaxID=314092 RepID=A0A9X1ZKT0_9GAMM|nr:hypothetical protein [Shewanella pneumatophori]MCL1137751.1 hypothetical protein [Shewanella pneumatophori]